MALAKYWKKRDFAKTPEPAGKPAKRKPKAASFVIQKHDASHLHYDFRLEMEGVLRSWAVPKGPSLDPADKRYAAHVEDHPLEYGKFEGVIPQGQYGGGPVVIWDRGTWVPDGDPLAGYRKGHIDFELKGVRLKGSWMLLRMAGRGREKDTGKAWLLVKKKDEHARPGEGDAVLEDRPESVVSGRNLDEVLAKSRKRWQSDRPEKTKPKPKKSKTKPRAAATATLARRAAAPVVAAAKKAPLPRSVEPELATLVEAPPAGHAWIHETKFDGYRVIARVEAGRATLSTRRGKDWTHRFKPVAQDVAALPVRDAVLDGEVVVVLEDGRSDFQALQGALSGGRDDDLAYFVFDLLHLDGRDLTSAPLLERKRALKALIDRAPRGSGLVYSDHVVGRGPDFLAAACKHRLEGVVSKRADSPYVGGRGRDWLKSKCKRGQELVVGGWTDPTGARQGFGALLVGVHDAKGALRFAGKIGTGYSDETLADLKKRLAAVETDESPFVDPPRGAEARGVHWTLPKLVVEAEFTEWTSDGKLRHPSFKGLRADKPAEDIVREEPKAAPGGKAPRRPATKAAPRRDDDEKATVAGVAITHPERVLYPEQGLTKFDLARYYEAVADWILPHVEDRLLTLVRCPDGSSGQCFFQKHGGFGLSDRVRRVPVKEKTKTDEYLVVDDLAGLVSLVQIGVLELHLWGSRADRFEEPDRMIFDLDPDPSVPWSRVVEAAHLLKERLEKLGLDTFAKTTGGKGLHVVAPLGRRAEQDWDVVKEFSRRVVEGVVREAPDRYTANMRKAERAGRIFIDYLRNGRGATAVAPYSPRARDNAPVATPIAWDELDGGVRSDSFTVKTIPKRLASLARDPWAGIDKTRQTLTKTMRRAVGMS